MSKLAYDAYIFDLDGTLTRSEPGIVRCVQYALEKMDIHGYSREDLRFFVGPPLLGSFEKLGLPPQEAARAVAFYRERYAAKGVFENEVYCGIPSLLRSLKAQGAYLAVATGKPQHFTELVLEHFGLRKYFDAVSGPLRDGEAPHKEIMIRRVLPQGAKRAVMIGDRDVDMLAGAACGLDVIGAGYGYAAPGELEGAGAERVARDMEALTRVLLNGAPVARGIFLSMEGSDGCGKSTQIKHLAEELRLRGHRVVTTREPGGCRIAERIREILLDAKEEGMSDVCEALLFAASRAQHVREVIRPALERGDVVLCDRFVDSSLVYQGVGRGLGDMVREINRPAVDGCMPDITLLLDIDPQLAISRRVAAAAPDRIERSKGGFMEKVHEGFRALANQERERFRVIDANGEPEEVFSRIREIIDREV